MRGQPQPGLRRFIAATASARSLFGPFGPGRRRCLGENNVWYFRLRSTLWRRNRVEGFKTMAERTTRAGRMNTVHRLAMIRSVARRLGARLRPRLRMQLMPDQHGFGDNGTESARPHQSGQGDDQMDEYDSEVAHSGNGINTSQTTAPKPVWQFAIDRSNQAMISFTTLPA